MDNSEVLGHLLKIESEAAILVNEAQAEADKRIAESEKLNKASYENHCRAKSEKLEKELSELIKLAQKNYRDELESYKEKKSAASIDFKNFSLLLDKFIMEET